MDHGRSQHFNAQRLTSQHRVAFVVEAPYCIRSTNLLDQVALSCLWRRIEDAAFAQRAAELNVLRLSPCEWHSRAGRSSVEKPSIGNVMRVPDLFRNHSALISECLHCF